MRKRLKNSSRDRQSKAGGDYRADLPQICPTRQLDQRLDRDQRSAYIYLVERAGLGFNFNKPSKLVD